MSHWLDIPSDDVLGAVAGCLTPDAVIAAGRQVFGSDDEARCQNWHEAHVVEALYHPGRYVRVAFALVPDGSVPSRRTWPEADLMYLHTPVRSPLSRRGRCVVIGDVEFEAYLAPNDRRLRGLRKFTGRQSATDTWQQWIDDGDHPGRIEIKTLQRLLLRYVPEHKWIARLRAEVTDAKTGERQKRRIAVRCASPSATARLQQRHDAMSRWAQSTEGQVSIPSVVGHHAELGLLALEWDRGNSLLDALREGSSPEVFRRVVGALRCVHTAPMPDLTSLSIEDSCGRARAMVDELCVARPDLALRLAALLASFGERMQRLDTVEPVTLHNDLHVAQIRMKRDRLALLDLERMAKGDPLVDVANLSVQLRLLGHRPEYSVDQPTAQRWADEFLAEWQRQSGKPLAADRLRCWSVLSLLGMAHGMMRHLRTDWRGLIDRCLEASESAYATSEREVVS